jgi:putative ABC transport system ATP-binding protein
MNNNVISANGLVKIYEQAVPVYALNGVDLQVSRGEFAVIVGPSGSGKTTLLNIIGGLDYPTEGKVIINGTDITTLSENKLIDFRMKHIGFVFQAFNLIQVLTAGENIEFVMLLQNFRKDQREKRVNQLLMEVGLSDKINERPGKLSGGQQQRVAVARALASKPEFVLADEPTANLDSKAAFILIDIMKKLNKEENMTFIFSTHDQRVIDKARRVITLEDGKIVNDFQRDNE